VRGQTPTAWQHLYAEGHFSHCWRDIDLRIITAMTTAQIPALLLIVASLLAPYGIARALTHYFPKHAKPYRDVRSRLF
jgi:hypothetical protein